MANFHGLLALPLVLFSLPVFSQGVAPIGAIDLAGWIKNESGTYTKAFGETARVTLTSPPSGISTTSSALVNTSKGVQAFDIIKTATVDTGRVGSIMANFAKRVGPVGMALTTASLICDLTEICDVNGVFEKFTSVTGTDAIKTHIGWCVSNGGSTPCFQDKDFDASVRAANACFSAVPSNCQLGQVEERRDGSNNLLGLNYKLTFISDGSSTGFMQATFMGSYTPPAPSSSPATSSDWDSKASLMNDDRFASELISKGESVPASGVPTLTADQKKGLGLDSKPTRDTNGNVTGREDTMTEIEAVDAGSVDNPGRVIIKETQTTVKYDLNNNVLSTNTNTSYSNQPQPSQPQPSNFEIKFDDVPPAELQTHVVPVAFTPDSWGSGTCPPDVEIAISLLTFSIPSQPVCSTAEMINPFVLTLASIMAIYIISGVRGGQT